MNNPYEVVRHFESMVATYAGAPYAIALDTCTDALFLACKYLQVEEVIIPCRTYISVPCSIMHAGGKVIFRDYDWRGSYYLDPYPIIDSSCRFTSGMYQAGTHYCVSFQYRKHLPIGRGGMILTDDLEAVEWYKLARFNGRHEVPLIEDVPVMVGWNCYMDPERAVRGMTLMMQMSKVNADLEFVYPDLSTFGLYV